MFFRETYSYNGVVCRSLILQQEKENIQKKIVNLKKKTMQMYFRRNISQIWINSVLLGLSYA